MKNRKTVLLFSLAFVFLIVAVGYAAGGFDKCPLCGMNQAGNENTAYEIVFDDGMQAQYCCPHCGLWEQASKKSRVKMARVRDFISGEWMDSSKMTYLFKSMAVPACAPSWIAFADKSEAEKFQKSFGGTLFDFDHALVERLRHPKGMEMKMKM